MKPSQVFGYQNTACKQHLWKTIGLCLRIAQSWGVEGSLWPSLVVLRRSLDSFSSAGWAVSRPSAIAYSKTLHIRNWQADTSSSFSVSITWSKDYLVSIGMTHVVCCWIQCSTAPHSCHCSLAFPLWKGIWSPF